MNWLEYHAEPVQLHSGGWSHWLVRADLIFEDEALRGAVLHYWEWVLKNWRPPLEVISVPTGGDRWAEVLRERLGPQPYDPTPYRVIVDDVVTTGASIDDPNAHIRLCVVDRRIRNDRPRVEAAIRLPLLAKSDMRERLG